MFPPLTPQAKYSFPTIQSLGRLNPPPVVAALILGFGYDKTFDNTLLTESYARQMTLYIVERKKPPAGLFQPPGGKVEASDIDVGFTASRESREEIGFDIIPVKYLGESYIRGLKDVADTTLHHVLCITRHNLGIESTRPETRLKPDENVRRYWISLEELFNGRCTLPQIPSLAESVHLIKTELASHPQRALLHARLVALSRKR
jgi:8-oxo-dGTP pyrophosphatase MutT (NUDIX family)